MFKPVNRLKRECLFISYSHHDAPALARLQVHLKPFERAGRIKRWDDTRIVAGQHWAREIREALSSARVAVLLISADFLASDFIVKYELPELLAAARSKDVVLLPVLLKPCAHHRHSALADIQFVNSTERPLAGLTEVEQEALWAKLADIITSYLPAVDAEESTGEATDPQLGRIISRRCDRLVQACEFKRLFDTHMMRGDERLQFYVVHGELGECHDSLIMRFLAHIESRASETGESSRAAMKTARGVWAFGPPHARLLHVLGHLAEELRPRPTRLDEEAISLALRSSLFSFVVLQYDLLVERWDRWMLMAIKDYAAFLKRATAYKTGAEVVVFLNVIYPASPGWLGWLTRKRSVARCLSGLESSAITVFPELEAVSRVDVIEWFKQHVVCDEAVVLRKCEEIFKAQGRRRMADIEPLLASAFEQYAADQGYR
jgi:hypothetical protein